MCVCVCVHKCVSSVMPDSSWHQGLQPAKLLCPWNFLGKNTRVGCHFLLQGNLPDPGIKPAFLVSSTDRWVLYHCATWEAPSHCNCVYECVLSHFQLFATLWTGACQAPLSMGFFRQEYCSGLPGPAPGDLPDPGIEPTSLRSPVLTGGFFPPSATNYTL